MDKVRFGLGNVKYALWDDDKSEYGTPVSFPGAVSLSTTREGGDSNDFYADNGVYHSFAGTNGGYSLELEMARITDQVRVDLLGEVVDSAGVQFEFTDAQPAKFALIAEMLVDGSKTAFAYYNCTASRPETTANTQGETPEVDTDTLNIRVAGEEVEYDGETKRAIQSHILKTPSNATEYAAFFTSIALPQSGGGESGLSA